ncbi:hypothetical protein PDIDSM_1066 [Penicillium digitatum]|nr:hypothetical protein PDIDSM_1066 [Penicillium digitatum]
MPNTLGPPTPLPYQPQHARWKTDEESTKGQLPPGPLPKGASAITTTRLDAKAREAKLLREVFETFAKTVDTFVASCKDDKRPSHTRLAPRARSDPETTSKKPTTWAGIAQTPKNPDIESQAKGTHRVAISSKAAPTSARSGQPHSQQRDDPRILVVLKQEDRLARKEPYAIRKQLESALKGVTPHTDIPKITRTATGLITEQGLNAIKDALNAHSVKVPQKWYNYAVPGVPPSIQAWDGTLIQTGSVIEDEVFAHEA